jgi:hypothetical protein
MWNREQDKATLRGSKLEGWGEIGRTRNIVASVCGKNISGIGNSMCRGLKLKPEMMEGQQGGAWPG